MCDNPWVVLKLDPRWGYKSPVVAVPMAGAPVPKGAATAAEIDQFVPTKAVGAHELMIASYNIENLFDTVKDPEKKDEQFTFGGEYAWTEAKLDRKLKSATTPEEKAALEQQIADNEARIAALKNNQPPPQATAKPTARPGGNTGATKPTVTKPACNCTPGDPLCSCL